MVEWQKRICDDEWNMNDGERQHIYAIWALFSHSIIISMDKATTFMDVQKDCLILEMIGSQFTDCTIITVVHTPHSDGQWQSDGYEGWKSWRVWLTSHSHQEAPWWGETKSWKRRLSMTDVVIGNEDEKRRKGMDLYLMIWIWFARVFWIWWNGKVWQRRTWKTRNWWRGKETM